MMFKKTKPGEGARYKDLMSREAAQRALPNFKWGPLTMERGNGLFFPPLIYMQAI